MTRSDIRPFVRSIDAAIMAHANAVRRQEICGIVTACRLARDGYRYHRLRNSAKTRPHFIIDPAALAGLPEALAVVHSHPASRLAIGGRPSSGVNDVAWGIAVPAGLPHAGVFWFGGDLTASLTRRGYRHGVTDCYALVHG